MCRVKPINSFQADATAVTKSGSNDFSFKADNHTHKFEAASSAERDSWVVAIEKIVEGSKGLKADITGRESYKHTLGDLCKSTSDISSAYSPANAASASHAASEGTHSTALKPDEPRTSIDAETARAAGPVDPINKAVNRDTSASSSDNEATRAKKADKKERSQSRKRSSVFGFFGKKDESDKKLEAEQEKELLKKHDHDAKKGDYEVVKKHDHDEAKKHDHEAKKREHEAKKRDHEAKKRDHEAAKEEKKLEAEHKKEMAKAEHDHSVAHETSEVAPVAAAAPAVVPVVATHADKNEEERTADKPVERLGEVTSPTEKKNKRASVFGGFFGKNKVTSPSSERSEKEVVPIVPVKDETPAVSETAPKLDEPIATKPLDTAAVTAPVDGTEPAAGPVAATTAEEPRSAELASPRETTLSPRSEKKSFLSGFMKKQDKREGAREEPMTNEEVAKEAVPVNAASESAVAEPATETPINEAEAREGRPAPEKRRTSIFGSLGTLKRKSDKSPGPSSVAADETKTTVTKREKSPMPSKLGGLFGKPSRAQNTTEGSKTDAPATIAQPEAATEAPTTIGETETPAETDVAKLHGETETVGDQVTSTFHDAVTNKPEETKSTA